MAQRDDILVDKAIQGEAGRPLRTKLAAFVPITVAVLGIGAILLGGVSARHNTTATGPAIDSINTGSIGRD